MTLFAGTKMYKKKWRLPTGHVTSCRVVISSSAEIGFTAVSLLDQRTTSADTFKTHLNESPSYPGFRSAE